MRILHCLHNYFPARGGAEWLMQNISERLAAGGHGVTVIATRARSTEDYFLRGRGRDLLPAGVETINRVQVRRVPFSRRGAGLLNLMRAAANRIPIPGGAGIRMLSWGPRSRAYPRAVLDAGPVDLIAAAPLPTLNIRYAWRAARRMGRPLVLIPCFHTEDPWTFHNPLHFAMLRDADAVITLTEWEKRYLTDEGGLDPGRVTPVGAGIDLDGDAAVPVGPVREKYRLGNGPVILFLGQHGAHKGIDHLIEALPYVWRKRPEAGLVIAGNPTAFTAEIERRISRLPRDRRGRVVLIKGFPENEKRALMRAADVFVSVSLFESFGIVFLEAWREKTPVIGCTRGGASQIIAPFRDGLLVDYGNPRQIAGAVLEILDSPETGRLMGERGYRKLEETLTWDKISTRWEAVYRDAVARYNTSSRR
jgi:glycosyltransferase involved in cell wall biosynthesis